MWRWAGWSTGIVLLVASGLLLLPAIPLVVVGRAVSMLALAHPQEEVPGETP